MSFMTQLRSFIRNGVARNQARRAPRRRTAPVRFLPRLEALEDRALPSTFTVMNLNDSGPYSLRAAIASGDDTINFANGLQGAVTLKTELSISYSVTINGPGANKLSISGNDANRIFDIGGSANVAISGLTLTDGLATVGGGILLEGSASLSLRKCMLTDNEAFGVAVQGIAGAGGFGGAIEDASSSGALTVADCTFDANRAVGIGTNSAGTGSYVLALGGAIDVSFDSTGPATISNSTFAGNQALGGSPGASAGGGALSNSSNVGGATMTITGCTLTSNTAIGGAGGDGATNFGSGQGGGVNDFANLTVRNSTLNGNVALGTPLAVVSQTVLGNSGTAGGGIFCLTPFVPSTVVIAGSTFRGNEAIGGAGAAGSAGNVGEGGGIALILVGPAVGGQPAIVDGCTLVDNVAQGGAGGSGAVGAPGASGGIDVAVISSAIVSNTTLIHNEAIGGAGGAGAAGGNGVGGGIDVGSGVLLFGPGSDSSSLTLANCILIGNEAIGGTGGSGSNGGSGLGGGLSVLGGSAASISSSIINANQAQGGAGGAGGNGGNGLGGGLYNDATATLAVLTSVVSGNKAHGGLAGAGGSSGAGIGGGVYSLGLFDLDAASFILGNDASTSNDNIFGVLTPI